MNDLMYEIEVTQIDLIYNIYQVAQDIVFPFCM